MADQSEIEKTINLFVEICEKVVMIVKIQITIDFVEHLSQTVIVRCGDQCLLGARSL